MRDGERGAFVLFRAGLFGRVRIVSLPTGCDDIRSGNPSDPALLPRVG